jgi:hypothetical protein
MLISTVKSQRSKRLMKEGKMWKKADLGKQSGRRRSSRCIICS